MFDKYLTDNAPCRPHRLGGDPVHWTLRARTKLVRVSYLRPHCHYLQGTEALLTRATEPTSPTLSGGQFTKERELHLLYLANDSLRYPVPCMQLDR